MKPRAKKKRAPKKVTTAAIAKALEQHYGNITDSARALRVDPEELRARVRAEPVLQAAQKEGYELLADLAEEKLFELAEDEDVQACIFLLKTKGKHRGFSERVELEVTGGVRFYEPGTLPLPPEELGELEDEPVVH